MTPVVCIEPNDCQTLLSHDDTIDDLKAHGWDVFLKKFEGYNLPVAQTFAQTFDGFRAKVGDVQLERIEDFISKVAGLPLKGEKWFKNAKIKDVPWRLFMVSRKSTCCPKVAMTPVVRIELNDFQTLLSHEDTIDDLKAHGRDVFLKKFEGYNLPVA